MDVSKSRPAGSRKVQTAPSFLKTLSPQDQGALLESLQHLEGSRNRFSRGEPALQREQKDGRGEQMGGCSAKTHDLCEQCGLGPPFFLFLIRQGMIRYDMTEHVKNLGENKTLVFFETSNYCYQ